MSMSINEFWLLIDFGVATVVNLFNILDTIVVIDSPRWTLFNFLVSVIFVALLIKTINWLRGQNGVGGSKWDYIMRREPDGLKDIPDTALDGSFLQENRRIQMAGNIVRYYQDASGNNVQIREPVENKGFLRDFVSRRRINTGHRFRRK